MRMVWKLTGCIWPMLAAYFCQIIISAIGMTVYTLLLAAFQVASGDKAIQEIMEEMLHTVMNPNVVLLLGGISIAGTLVMGMLWYRLYRPAGERPMKQFFNGKYLLFVLLSGVSLQLLISMGLNIIYPFLPKSMTENYSALMEGLLGGNLLLSLAVTVVLAPVAEEFIFRGVIMQKAKKFLPFYGANLLQAVLFAIYHGNMIQGLYAFGIGLMFGWIAGQFHSVWAAVLLHACVNGSAQLLSLIPETVTEHSHGIAGMILAGILCLLTAGWLLRDILSKQSEMDSFSGRKGEGT